MKILVLPAMLMAFTSLLVGCVTPIPLKPGAEKVVISNQVVPQDCQYVGNVSNVNRNGAQEAYTTHENLQALQINHLKNQALAIEANYVLLTAHDTTYKRYSRNKSQKLLDTHALAGRAYRCPSTAISQLKDQVPEMQSTLVSPEHSLYQSK